MKLWLMIITASMIISFTSLIIAFGDHHLDYNTGLYLFEIGYILPFANIFIVLVPGVDIKLHLNKITERSSD